MHFMTMITPMHRLILAAAASVALSGCLGAGATLEATPAQRLYDGKGTYKEVLEIATEYSEDCDTSPAVVRADCIPIVAEIQRLDDAIADAQAVVEAAVRSGDGTNADLARQALQRAVDALEAYLIEQAIMGEDQ